MLKIHDKMTCRFRHSQNVTLGTVKKDTLCMDATDKMVAVGGLISQKVWVFSIKEGPPATKNAFRTFMDAVSRAGKGSADLGDESTRPRRSQPENRVFTDIFKFINAGSGVTAVKLSPSSKRMAVLMPLSHKVEVWDIKDVMRMQSHDVMADAQHMVWRDGILLTATNFSGQIEVFDSDREVHVASLSDAMRRIDSLALYRRLCATGEGRHCRIWSLGAGGGGAGTDVHRQPGLLASFVATKTFVSALAMNDVILATGSSSGIVKLWDLQVSTVSRRVYSISDALQ